MACIGNGKELMGSLPVPRPTGWTVMEAEARGRLLKKLWVWGGFETFLSLLYASLLQVCYCLQGYLSLLGLLP